MITVKELLSETKMNVGNVIHVISNPQVTNSEVQNIEHSISQPGRKHIFHTSNITPETKKHYQNAVGNYSHFFRKDGDVKTVFDAVDKVKGDGKPITVMTHPNQVQGLQQSFSQSHPQEKITVKPLPNDKEPPIKSTKDLNQIHHSVPRAEARKMVSEAFEIGDVVTDGTVTGEIINLHPRYATIVSEGKEHRIWINELDITEAETKKDRIYKESFTYRGYKSKNLSRELAEQFKAASKDNEDVYGLLNCLKSCDYIMGVSHETIVEDFKTTRIQLERARRYGTRFNINITEQIYAVEEGCLQFAVLEGIPFTTTDKFMIARLIASVADIKPSGIDPTAIINNAIQKLRVQVLTPNGWELMGRMMNVATKAGIRWNKDNFSTSQLKLMGLVE